MPAIDLPALTAAACRRRHYSHKTLQSYSGWAARYARWLARQPALKTATSEVKVSTYLGWLASRPGGCSAVTQKQALNALVFAYREALGRALGQMPDWVKPAVTRRLPVWLSRAEFDRLTRHLTGDSLDLARLMFGAGLRLNEALKLRVRDLDFDAGWVVVRGGKGDKDRLTCLPRSLREDFAHRINRLRDLWQRDREANLPGVWLPPDVARKFPRYGLDWPWQFLFPGRSPSRDPETGIVRRHHVHEDTLAKALKRAARLSGLSKRITAHTLRHSFATAFLEAGGGVHQLQELLGHKSLETTEIYTHCTSTLAGRITSPLDLAASNVVPVDFSREMTNATPTAMLPSRGEPQTETSRQFPSRARPA